MEQGECALSTLNNSENYKNSFNCIHTHITKIYIQMKLNVILYDDDDEHLVRRARVKLFQDNCSERIKIGLEFVYANSLKTVVKKFIYLLCVIVLLFAYYNIHTYI